jgi:hypothetical protein
VTAAGPVAGGNVGMGPDEEELAGTGSRKRNKTAKEKAPKAPKEYIPGIGTANYAFLIVLLEVRLLDCGAQSLGCNSDNVLGLLLLCCAVYACSHSSAHPSRIPSGPCLLHHEAQLS